MRYPPPPTRKERRLKQGKAEAKGVPSTTNQIKFILHEHTGTHNTPSGMNYELKRKGAAERNKS